MVLKPFWKGIKGGTRMMAAMPPKRCPHKECTKDKQEWLPVENEVVSIKKTNQLKKHPYCENCGLVKSIRMDRAKPIGFYTNVLSDIKDYLYKENRRTRGFMPKLTATQMRLIIDELEELPDFEDDFVRNRREQSDIFVKIVKKHIPQMSEELIRSFIL
jgi:hypothetical protein